MWAAWHHYRMVIDCMGFWIKLVLSGASALLLTASVAFHSHLISLSLDFLIYKMGIKNAHIPWFLQMLNCGTCVVHVGTGRVHRECESGLPAELFQDPASVTCSVTDWFQTRVGRLLFTRLNSLNDVHFSGPRSQFLDSYFRVPIVAHW